MTRTPRLLADLANASRGLTALGADMAELEVRLSRMDSGTGTYFDPPEAWADLLGTAEFATDRLRLDTREPQQSLNSTASATSRPQAHSESTLRKSEPGLRVHQNAASSQTNASHYRTKDTVADTSSDRATTTLGGTAKAPHVQAAAAQVRRKLEHPSLSVRDPLAARGADQSVQVAVAPSETSPLSVSASPISTNTPQTPVPSRQEARMSAILDRIHADTRARGGRDAGTSGAIQPRGVDSVAPTPSYAQSVAAPQVASTPPASPVPSPVANSLGRSGGLSRLLARGKELGIAGSTESGNVSTDTMTAPDHQTHANPAPPVQSLRIPSGADLLHSPVDLPRAASGPASIDLADPFLPTPEASPATRDRLARYLADVLREEARAAGIDLDGGAP